MNYRVKTPNHNTTVQASDFNIGGDGWLHLKADGDTVWSVPEVNVEGFGPEGVLV